VHAVYWVSSLYFQLIHLVKWFQVNDHIHDRSPQVLPAILLDTVVEVSRARMPCRAMKVVAAEIYIGSTLAYTSFACI